jgi:uncharacterized RDD family membrane protein YckC
MNQKIIRENNMHASFISEPPKNTKIGELATPQSRLIALLLDGLIFGLGFGVIWLIWFITLAERGTTPGHHLMGHTIVDVKTGKALGWKKMVLREVFIKGVLHWVLGSFLFMVNYIIDGVFIFTASQRTLHDLLVGSHVIQSSSATIMQKFKVNQVETWLNK